MKSIVFVLLCVLCFSSLFSQTQNVGIGTTTPTEKLEVNGNIKATNVIAGNVNGFTVGGSNVSAGTLYIQGGLPYSFLMTENESGQVGFRRGRGGVGIRYIIATGAPVAQATGTPNYTSAFAGEIKIFAGTIAPAGWIFCEGQLLPTSTYPNLFNTIGYTYGGGGVTYMIPNLQGAVPVGTGNNVAGYSWIQGQSDLD